MTAENLLKMTGKEFCDFLERLLAKELDLMRRQNRRRVFGDDVEPDVSKAEATS